MPHPENCQCDLCALSRAMDAPPLPPGARTMSLEQAFIEEGVPADVARKWVIGGDESCS